MVSTPAALFFFVLHHRTTHMDMIFMIFFLLISYSYFTHFLFAVK